MTLPLAKLIEVDEPAWPWVAQLFSNSPLHLDVIPAQPTSAERTLFEAQLTLRSPLGALLFHTAGVLVDHGWLRLYGSGSDARFRTGFEEINIRGSGYSMVASDILGGRFALNGGALGDDLGKVYYFAPDCLAWEPLHLTYSDFLLWCLQEHRLAQFYASERWPHWAEECQHLSGDDALLIYPFPWAAGPPLQERARRVVPVQELLSLYAQMGSEFTPG